jgi:hypothetical protein
MLGLLFVAVVVVTIGVLQIRNSLRNGGYKLPDE